MVPWTLSRIANPLKNRCSPTCENFRCRAMFCIVYQILDIVPRTFCLNSRIEKKYLEFLMLTAYNKVIVASLSEQYKILLSHV